MSGNLSYAPSMKKYRDQTYIIIGNKDENDSWLNVSTEIYQ